MKISELPEGERELALLRQKEKANGYITDCINVAFIWRHTKEGHEYWKIRYEAKSYAVLNTTEKEEPKHQDNSKGIKESTGKLTYELDFNFIESIAARMAKNKGKYEPYNWQRTIDIDQLKQSLFRHCMEVMKDNYEDEGDALGHLEAIAINAMIINYQLKNK
jgi:hypothetical protein